MSGIAIVCHRAKNPHKKPQNRSSVSLYCTPIPFIDIRLRVDELQKYVPALSEREATHSLSSSAEDRATRPFVRSLVLPIRPSHQRKASFSITRNLTTPQTPDVGVAAPPTIPAELGFRDERSQAASSPSPSQFQVPGTAFQDRPIDTCA